MEVLLTTDDANGMRDNTRASGSRRVLDPIADQELVREVAASLKSLAKVLPYPEYAAIVHRIAHIRLRCGCVDATSGAEAAASASVHRSR